MNTESAAVTSSENDVSENVSISQSGTRRSKFSENSNRRTIDQNQIILQRNVSISNENNSMQNKSGCQVQGRVNIDDIFEFGGLSERRGSEISQKFQKILQPRKDEHNRSSIAVPQNNIMKLANKNYKELTSEANYKQRE